jgi:hypothetical protein
MLEQGRRQKVHGMWFTTTTFPSNVHFTYSYKRLVPTVEEPPRELYALLHGLPPEMGVLGSEWYEDIFKGPGDSTED